MVKQPDSPFQQTAWVANSSSSNLPGELSKELTAQAGAEACCRHAGPASAATSLQGASLSSGPDDCPFPRPKDKLLLGVEDEGQTVIDEFIVKKVPKAAQMTVNAGGSVSGCVPLCAPLDSIACLHTPCCHGGEIAADSLSAVHLAEHPGIVLYCLMLHAKHLTFAVHMSHLTRVSVQRV